MSQSSNSSLSTPNPTFVPDIYQVYARSSQLEFVTLCLLVGLYGVLTMLSALSCYVLLTQSNRKSRPTIILGLTVFALFVSTTMYMVSSVLDYQSSFIGTNTVSSALKMEPDLTKDYTTFQSCTSATTLVINVRISHTLLLGDAIVCWRTCVVWHQNRAVKAVCSIFLFVTSMVGVVDSAQSCKIWRLDADPDIFGETGTVFEGIAIGIAACVLSLSTNAIATLLVGCKAWQLRRGFRRYLAIGSRTSQVQKLLSLLIESGAVYCALLAMLLTFQVANLYNGMSELPAPAVAYFLDIFAVIANGALIPMIAIYPTVVIIVVVLNRSHMEKGLTQHLEDILTPQITSTTDTIADSFHGASSPAELLAFDEEGVRHANKQAFEHTGGSRDVEPKARVEGIV